MDSLTPTAEQIERLELMAAGDSHWDLSDKDTNAIGRLLQAWKDSRSKDDEIQARWQKAIYELCKKLAGADAHRIDGAGCESGDPLDMTLAEIRQVSIFAADKLAEKDEEIERLRGVLAKIAAENCSCGGSDRNWHSDRCFKKRAEAALSERGGK